MTENMEDRPAPWARNAVLLVAFLALVAVGVFTVLLPSLEDAPAEGASDGGTPAAAAEAP